MIDIRTIDANKFNLKLAEAIKKLDSFPKPDWAVLVKTSPHNKRPPTDEDFWYKRSASILRQLYLNGTVGVERLRSRYGGRKNRGAKPSKFKKSGGKIIRTILQQAQKAELIEKSKIKSGRQLTKKGIEFLENVAK